MIKEIIGSSYKNVNFKPVPEFKIIKGLSPRKLMEHVALFTNQHFFSNDTIFDYKKWIFPRNHKKPYPTPQLSRLRCVKGVYYSLFKTIGWVPLARETGLLFSKVLGNSTKYGRKNPKFNVLPDMAEAQAKVLIPVAVYNCAELINSFLPTLKLHLSVKRNGGNSYWLSGELIHEIDNDPE